MKDDNLLALGDTYYAYGNHTMSDRWSSYEKGARLGALRQAIGQFEDALGHPLIHPEDQESLEKRFREAVPEQAMALLILSRVPTAGNAKDAFCIQSQAASTVADVPEITMSGAFSLAALRKAGWRGHAVIRG